MSLNINKNKTKKIEKNNQYNDQIKVVFIVRNGKQSEIDDKYGFFINLVVKKKRKNNKTQFRNVIYVSKVEKNKPAGIYTIQKVKTKII
jgi:hypothetical protein